MQKYDTILFDADNTLFDFHAAERQALRRTAERWSIPLTPQRMLDYSQYNKQLWHRFDLGEITRDWLAVERFAWLLRETGGDESLAPQVNGDYARFLGQGGMLYPGAEELCRALAPTCALYIVTNGLTAAQTGRLACSPIRDVIRKMYISQEMNCQKPQRAFFEKVFADLALDAAAQARTLVVGDNLHSDILGAVNSGLDSVWYNPDHEPNTTDICPTFEAAAMEEIRQIILGG